MGSKSEREESMKDVTTLVIDAVELGEMEDDDDNHDDEDEVGEVGKTVRVQGKGQGKGQGTEIDGSK